MKQLLLFIAMVMTSVGVFSQNIFISQNCDPQYNYAPDRFVEIYNPTESSVDLTGWTVENWQNGSLSFTWTLNGTIESGQALVCGRADDTDQTISPDFTTEWIGAGWNGGTTDGSILKDASGTVIDYAIGGSYANKEMVRNANITSPSTTYNASEWTITSIANAVDATPGTHTCDLPASSTKVATPYITPGTGTYFETQTVTISCTTDGATIYYTTDGTEPTEIPANLYSAPFEISATTTVTAVAVKEGMDNSSLASAIYTFPAITEVSTIADLRAQVEGGVYKLVGEAVLVFQNSYNGQKFLKDATGGIWIYDADGIISTTYNVGDAISGITGTLGSRYSGLTIAPVMDSGVTVSTGNDVTPTVVTIPQLEAGWDIYESTLVTVEEVDFEDADAEFSNGGNFDVTDASLNSLVVRTAFYTDLSGELIPAKANVTGIAMQYNGTYQVAPRSISDVVSISTDVAGVASASSIYPNPFNTQITVTAEAIATVEVMNAVGQLVAKVEGNGMAQVVVPTAELAKGIYIVKVTEANGKVVTKKVMKK